MSTEQLEDKVKDLQFTTQVLGEVLQQKNEYILRLELMLTEAQARARSPQEGDGDATASGDGSADEPGEDAGTSGEDQRPSTT